MNIEVPIDPRYQPGIYYAFISPFLFGLGGGKDNPP
jgi:hypothetical protein